ncbi:hybrid sensor histidine kinase/response regulator [Burkholderia sp. WAC0059]|uniref:hybrid sensor histidine kinase/response regulator n=1 Tax=Burkholderia sp. WAC0059 TaxID=2066022 RepID=UPI000C7EB0CC|nr:response regulator [Burkholderia sp. WAC0059]PLZ03678.1 hybrid sensor histidine kinase/response regulator [Burkholderia sp. WAC0059]
MIGRMPMLAEAGVLVVDDDPAVLEHTRLSLAGAGAAVTGCPNLDDAIALLGAQTPDLLVLDDQLGGPETGLDFFVRLRASGMRIPAILVTDFADESRVIAAMRAGVSDVVPKSGDYLGYLPEAAARVLAQIDMQRASAEALLLRDREEHYRTLSEALPHLVLTCGADGNCDFVSTQWLAYTGLDEASSLGLAWLDAVHPEDREEIRHTWLSAVGSGATDYRHELRIRRRDGIYRWFDVRIVAVRNARGGVSKWFGSCTDIHSQHESIEDRERLLTSEQAARQAAEEANRAKDRFLAMLSHELRTPLTPVLAGTRLLEQIPGLPDAARAGVRMIRRNIELEARLIDDLLDLTRVANGKLSLALETVDVHEVIDSVLELFHSEIQVKQQDVRLDLRAERHHVRGDRARLQQMLWNLVRNAAKFTPDGGYIFVRTRDDETGRLQIEVEDTGIGIAPEQIGKLFNAFEQGSHNMTRQFGGLGLGLAVTKALTDAHGGSVVARSPGPHCGATFSITLPATQPQPEAPAPPDRPGSNPAGPLNILLIEDHEDTAEVMAQLIRSLGHEVSVAGRVADALALTQTTAFDLVLSDVGLPDGTGLDFIDAFRRRSAVPAIALTGFGTDEDVRRCIEAGFSSHLTKPVNFAQLEQLIEQAGSGRLGEEDGAG